MLFYVSQIISAILLFVAVGDHPYGYYQFMRVVVFLVAVNAASGSHDIRRPVWMWLYIGIAFLFNPIFPIHLNRQLWASIDFCTAMFFIVGMFFVRKPQEETKEPSNVNSAKQIPPPTAPQVTHALCPRCNFATTYTSFPRTWAERNAYATFRFDLRRLNKRAFALLNHAEETAKDLAVEEDGYLDEDRDIEPIFESYDVVDFIEDFRAFVENAEVRFNKLSQEYPILLYSESDYEEEKACRIECGHKVNESTAIPWGA
jgi:uncharacterized membrane protein YhaH (DUF805 family)